jgi:hypothetical protein
VTHDPPPFIFDFVISQLFEGTSSPLENLKANLQILALTVSVVVVPLFGTPIDPSDWAPPRCGHSPTGALKSTGEVTE